MNIPTTLDILGVEGNKDKIWSRFRNVYNRVQRAVNGNIEFGNPTSGSANIRGTWVSVTSPGVANTDFTITHNLGRAAVGYMVMTKNAAGNIYTSPTANPNPTTQLILRASVASLGLTIFVI
jgi:hypothetical protein